MTNLSSQVALVTGASRGENAIHYMEIVTPDVVGQVHQDAAGQQRHKDDAG